MKKNIQNFFGLVMLSVSFLVGKSSSAQTTVKLTQSLDSSTFQTSYISCGVAGLYTAANSYLRKYDLVSYQNQYGNQPKFKVTGIRFGVLLNDLSHPLYVKLYRFNGGAFTMANCTLIDADTINLPYTWMQRMTANVEGIFNSTDVIVLELNSPDGSLAWNRFAVGSNVLGQTDTSYLMSTECGIMNPTNVASIVSGADMHLMLDVIGYGGAPPFQPDPYTVKSDTICKGMAGVVYTVPPVTNATSYQWEYTGTGATIIPNGNSAQVSFSTNATGGVLKVKAVNEFGVSPSRDITIFANNQFNVRVNPSHVNICQGDTAILEVDYVSTIYNWQPPSGLDTIATKIVKASPINSNYYTVTVIDPLSGCIGTGTSFVEVHQPPTVVYNPNPLIICGDDSVTVSMTGAATYLWTPNTYLNTDTGAIIKMLPDRNFSYNVAATNAYGCVTNEPINVTINGILSPTVTQNGKFLSVPNTYTTYRWYQEGTPVVPTADNNTYTVKMPGKYKCYVTSANGCGIFSDEIDVKSLGINDLNTDLITLYPNPTKDKIYIKSDIALGATLQTIDGRVLMQSDNTNEIDLTKYSKGMYIVLLKDEKTNQTATFKIIKE